MNKSLQAVPPTVETTGLEGPCSSLRQFTGLILDCPSYDSGFKKIGSTLTLGTSLHLFESQFLQLLEWSGSSNKITGSSPPPNKELCSPKRP